MENYEILPHPADIKVRIWAKDRLELLKNALIALKEISGPEWLLPHSKVEVEIKASGSNFGDLMVDFLSQVVSLADVYNAIFFEIEVQSLTDNTLSGRVFGYHFRSLDKEIKGVSYHNINYQEKEDFCEITVIFDI